MQHTLTDILSRVAVLRAALTEQYGMDPIEHCLSRIKAEDSMREKCRRQSLPETAESALVCIHDAIGIRIVCAFLDDVYRVVAYLKSFDDLEVFNEKDYIRNVKPNGYRSYHMILRTADGYFVEIQVRTISMDTWAALEHHMKYKKNISANLDLIGSELKRCADELASTDVSMQEIRNLIFNSK
jgi:ppGpp synthetase/RelA/SpoT-type nucleotidyltranferase